MSNAHFNDSQATPTRRASQYVRPRGPFANYAAACRKYRTLSGRATRTEFASFTVLSLLVLLALLGGGVGLIALGNLPALELTFVGNLAPTLAIVSFIAAVLFALFYFVAGVSVTARRLHDLNWSSSLLLLIFVFSLFIGFPLVLLVAFLLFAPGTRGSNRYGFDPRLDTKTQDASVFSLRADYSQTSSNPYFSSFSNEQDPADDATSNAEFWRRCNDALPLAPSSDAPFEAKR